MDHSDHSEKRLSESICLLARAIHALAESGSIQTLLLTMSNAIQDFATAQNAFNDQIDTAIAGLTGDIKNLSDQIQVLQTSAGTITPADQATLDAIQARAKVISDKLTALDNLTPPAVPAPTPPTTGV